MQYALWDRFKQLSTVPVRTISNLAHFLAFLVGNFSLSLSVLKAVEFSEQMEPRVTLFFTIFFKYLLTKFDEDKVLSMLKRITESKELFVLREQIVIFFQQLYAKEKKNRDTEDKQAWALLSARLKMAKKVMKKSTDFNFWSEPSCFLSAVRSGRSDQIFGNK